MTILRLPDAGQLSTATRLATEDDASVAAGFLAVTVRPWQVMMRSRSWAGVTEGLRGDGSPRSSSGRCYRAWPGAGSVQAQRGLDWSGGSA
jgi:hypothetical protein